MDILNYLVSLGFVIVVGLLVATQTREETKLDCPNTPECGECARWFFDTLRSMASGAPSEKELYVRIQQDDGDMFMGMISLFELSERHPLHNGSPFLRRTMRVLFDRLEGGDREEQMFLVHPCRIVQGGIRVFVD